MPDFAEFRPKADARRPARAPRFVARGKNVGGDARPRVRATPGLERSRVGAASAMGVGGSNREVAPEKLGGERLGFGRIRGGSAARTPARLRMFLEYINAPRALHVRKTRRVGLAPAHTPALRSAPRVQPRSTLRGFLRSHPPVSEFTDGPRRVQGDTWKYTSAPSARVRTRHVS